MKLVKFKNGKYGIRRTTLFGYQFLSNNANWWGKGKANDFELEHTEEKARELLYLLTDKGEPV